MAGTRSNPQLTTRSGLVHASGPPSLRAGQKCATSVVDNTANKKPKPTLEIEQELSEEEDQGGVRKKGKGKQRAKAPRHMAADKALEEVAAVIPARLLRTEQALLDSGISVAPPKRTRMAAISSTDPMALTMSINTCQRRTNAPIEEENDPRGNKESGEENDEGSKEGSKEGSEEGSEEVSDTSRTADSGGGHESSANNTTTGLTCAPNVHKPENTRKPLHVTTTGPTRAPTNICEPENTHVPDVSTPTHAPNNVATPGPTRTTDVHEAENTRAPAPNVNESSPNKVCEPNNTHMSDMSSPTCALNFDDVVSATHNNMSVISAPATENDAAAIPAATIEHNTALYTVAAIERNA
ncbi:hypothetical protein DXG01_002046, partial [Tephrocybe rancida]